jgi:GntR family carbon starvation induced transcriptional regulator
MVSRATLTSQLEQAIRADIVEGVLRPGHRLRQNELADRYGVSQTPLREALQKLAATGLVVLDPMAGAYVSHLSDGDLVDIFYLRALLEPIALRRSIERADPDWIARVEAAMKKLRAATERDSAVPAVETVDSADQSEAALAWSRAHREFHEVLLSRCDSPWLTWFVDILWVHSERYARAASAGGRNVNDEHEEIYRDVHVLDEGSAAESLRHHLEMAVAARRKSMAKPVSERAEDD